jgi:uncharacterized protein YcbX
MDKIVNENLVPLLGILYCSLFLISASTSKKKIKVKELWVYPIKSCKGVSLPSSLVSKTGFLYDRVMMIVDQSYKFQTQRNLPKMALIKTSIDFETKNLILEYPNLELLSLSLEDPQTQSLNHPPPLVQANVWGDICDSTDLGDVVSDWLNRALLRSDLRLVRISEKFIRKTDENVAPLGQVVGLCFCISPFVVIFCSLECVC